MTAECPVIAAECLATAAECPVIAAECLATAAECRVTAAKYIVIAAPDQVRGFSTRNPWIPACAGMTGLTMLRDDRGHHGP